jgi:hypothetical protein
LMHRSFESPITDFMIDAHPEFVSMSRTNEPSILTQLGASFQVSERNISSKSSSNSPQVQAAKFERTDSLSSTSAVSVIKAQDAGGSRTLSKHLRRKMGPLFVTGLAKY